MGLQRGWILGQSRWCKIRLLKDGLGWAATAHCHGRTVQLKGKATGLVAAGRGQTSPSFYETSDLWASFTVHRLCPESGGTLASKTSPASLAPGRRTSRPHVATRGWRRARAGLPARLAKRGDERGHLGGAAALACTHAWQRTPEARMREGCRASVRAHAMQGAEAAGARTHGHARYSYHR